MAIIFPRVWSLSAAVLLLLISLSKQSAADDGGASRSIIGLPLGDINIVAVTDVHSWVAGLGRHESPTYDAGYGDVLSFYNHLQTYCETHKKDLFFVMNGDFVDGTGLSTRSPEHLTPILKHMPWDAITLGNHELFLNKTVEYMIDSGFVDHWNGGFLTSNTVLSDSGAPVGDRYTYLYGKHSKSTILSFGFLYNFMGGSKLTTVEQVQQVVQQAWFQDVLSLHNYDAILVLAHMDCEDPLISVILGAIRSIAGEDMPVQFITGHTHARKFAILDNAAASLEAGSFSDTVGFTSFPLRTPENANAPLTFRHDFLDSNKQVFKDMLGLGENDPLETPDGIALTKLIQETRESLGLTKVLGCSNTTYQIDAPLDNSTSLVGLYLSRVIPSQLLRHNDSKIFFQNTGDFRYPLYQGEVILDDVVAVDPFNFTIFEISNSIPGSVLAQALKDYTSSQRSKYPATLPSVGISPPHTDIDQSRNYALYATSLGTNRIMPFLLKATGVQGSSKAAYNPVSNVETLPFSQEAASLPSDNDTFYNPTPVLDESGTMVVTSTGLWRDYFVSQGWSSSAINCDGLAALESMKEESPAEVASFLRRRES